MNVPKSNFGHNAVFIVSGFTPGANYYVIGNQQGGASGFGMITSGSFKPVDALAIDSKIDDKRAAFGNVLGSSAGLCMLGAEYDLSITAENCNLNIRIGITTNILE